VGRPASVKLLRVLRSHHDLLQEVDMALIKLGNRVHRGWREASWKLLLPKTHRVWRYCLHVPTPGARLSIRSPHQAGSSALNLFVGPHHSPTSLKWPGDSLV
jgi:hypothetical protein